jgi:iron complex outermembrane recepter protein
VFPEKVLPESKNNKTGIHRASFLCATSCIALGICFTGQSFAQTADTSSLPPVVVQSPTVKRTTPKTAHRASRSRSAARSSRNAGQGTAESSAEGNGAGKRKVESAFGHVDGYVATQGSSGTKTDTPLLETPAAISVITQDQIRAQVPQTISQAVRYTSGTRAETSGADTRFEDIYIRGFPADEYLDGMKLFTSGFSTSMIEPYNLERVEVLHGPASVLYGQASPGGLVNLVSKRPTEDPYHEMFLFDRQLWPHPGRCRPLWPDRPAQGVALSFRRVGPRCRQPGRRHPI